MIKQPRNSSMAPLPTPSMTQPLRVELTAKERGQIGSRWDSDTRLQMLALEFARYMPEEAEKLAAVGKRRLLAA